MRARWQEVARLVESYRSGVAVAAIGGRPVEIAAPLSHVVERTRQILVLPGRQLIAAHRRSASSIEQLTAVRPLVGREPAGRLTDDSVDDARGARELGRHRLAIRTE